MSTPDNPAGRLYQAIIDIDNTYSPDDFPIRAVLAVTHDIRTDDRSQTFLIMARLIQLTLDSKKLVRALDGIDHNRYLEPISNIEEIFSQVNLDTPWKEFRLGISENTLSSLQFVSDMLSMRAGEKLIDEASLPELLVDVNAILEKLLESQLPEDLKEDLLVHLEDIRSAIIDYRLFGLASLKKTFDNNLGLIIRRRDEMEEVEGNDWKGIMSSLVSLG